MNKIMIILKVKICQFQENEHFENHHKLGKVMFINLAEKTTFEKVIN